MTVRKLAPWPWHDDDEIAAATAVLRSGRVNYWTGDEGRAFEAEYAKATRTKHGLAVANGTLALELALYGLGVGPGDDVLVPARTFVATASAVSARGARPIVCDIDPVSGNLTAETCMAALTPRTKAVIAVHLAGWPADMEMILAFASQYGLKVIEDCAQAHGAEDQGRPVGGIGHAGCFSFCQDKIVTTGGEGGMVVTNDSDAFRKMWSYRDHGKDFIRTQTPDPAPGFKWLVDSFGTNWRMTEMQAAIGRIQLRKLPDWVARRRAAAAAIADAVKGIAGVSIGAPGGASVHAYYRQTLSVDPAALKPEWSRDRICTELDARGIPARAGSCPDISREKAFAKAGLPVAAHPQADTCGARTIVFPVHPTLTADDVAYISTETAGVLRVALR
ncbi:MAG: DegT/DnrJ/EryC1/StrS family aminotransferase [Rhodospirillaceae bacterium]|nr:DegT/DnrJ/EryC1/StrS family aminotransferase [Rhodospirillaceae bacterium]